MSSFSSSQLQSVTQEATGLCVVPIAAWTLTPQRSRTRPSRTWSVTTRCRRAGTDSGSTTSRRRCRPPALRWVRVRPENSLPYLSCLQSLAKKNHRLRVQSSRMQQIGLISSFGPGGGCNNPLAAGNDCFYRRPSCRWTAVVLRLRCGSRWRTPPCRDPARSASSRPAPPGSSSTAAPRTAASSGSPSRCGTAASSWSTTCSPRRGAWDTALKVNVMLVSAKVKVVYCTTLIFTKSGRYTGLYNSNTSDPDT